MLDRVDQAIAFQMRTGANGSRDLAKAAIFAISMSLFTAQYSVTKDAEPTPS